MGFDLPQLEHFREHFERDYSLLAEQINEEEGCVWLFKLINYMLDEKFMQEGSLSDHDKVVRFETHVEEQIILPRVNSIVDDVQKYKVAYIEFLKECTKEFSIEDYVTELKQDEKRFPFLSYFNVTNIHTVDPMNEFSRKLTFSPHGSKTYPITTFLLKKINDYANIRYLYPIVVFPSHLIQKFDHRIKRNDALTKTISDFLNQ